MTGLQYPRQVAISTNFWLQTTPMGQKESVTIRSTQRIWTSDLTGKILKA